ncbi:hypothetical protein ACA910_005237 [Epithemia clementina (nom. ined.)]
MFDVTTFLMRWMFLSNILRNVAEIQTFPQQQVPHPQPPPTPSLPQQQKHVGQDAILLENHWRNNCLQTILSYPPGKHRLLIVDAYRIELVQRLAHSLTLAQECLRRHTVLRISSDQERTDNQDDNHRDKQRSKEYAHSMDPDADLEVLQAMQQRSQSQEHVQSAAEESLRPTFVSASHSDMDKSDEMPLPGQPPTNQSVPTPTQVEEQMTQPHQVAHNLPIPPGITPALARERLKQIREYLPQLVSAVLKCPPAVDPSIANPIHLLRQLLLNRCAQDPSWGIELCWLLEADVGRAWKALLEHPQRTGRRLLVILPAEKAAVLAKLGQEKSAAFDLLQGAEQATAFGYSNIVEPFLSSYADPSAAATEQNSYNILSPLEPRLPSSLSQRRCAHFGDTMHFVDRLTKLSLDLRRVPKAEREGPLQEGLKEMNRRIRRRMVTRGEVSLDMEDNFGPDDWPRVEDLKLDMLQHSVHFPLIPQTGTWPTGKDGYAPSQETLDVVRVLNIVVSESRILSSRERCPFLVQLEVADTGIEGHDARLYTVGAPRVGSTVEEALLMNAMSLQSYHPQSQTQMMWGEERRPHQNGAVYNIPRELLTPATAPPPKQRNNLLRHDLPRGGSISSDGPYPYEERHQFPNDDQHYDHNQNYPNNQHYYPDPYHEQIFYQDESSPYSYAHQGDLQDIHLQLHSRQEAWQSRQYTINPNQEHQRSISRGKELLDSVFGVPWAERCMEIKQTSPFGKVDGWRLASFIMKAGEDIRKEALVMQIIAKMRAWFDDEIEPALRPIMRPYTIMSVGGDAGLVECLSDAKSVDEVKKKTDNFESLRDYFIRAYGPPGTPESQTEGQISFEKAQDNFLRSLVGYSLVCYVLQIKDRHNANILLDRYGHVMHIDFGFVLGDTPKMGKVPIFSERAPFKLSAEFWDVLGGWNTRSGGLGVQFCKMFDKAFACASKHAEEIGVIVEMTMLGLDYDPRTARLMANGVRSRLRMRGPPGSEQQQRFIVELVSAARASWGTTTYDWLQKNMNGYQ